MSILKDVLLETKMAIMHRMYSYLKEQTELEEFKTGLSTELFIKHEFIIFSTLEYAILDVYYDFDYLPTIKKQVHNLVSKDKDSQFWENLITESVTNNYYDVLDKISTEYPQDICISHFSLVYFFLEKLFGTGKSDENDQLKIIPFDYSISELTNVRIYIFTELESFLETIYNFADMYI